MTTFNEKNLIQQNFPLPSSIIWYICRTSKTTHIVLFKLYNSCKYFWSEIKILPVYSLKSHRCFHGCRFQCNGRYCLLVQSKYDCVQIPIEKKMLAKNNIKLFVYENLFFGGYDILPSLLLFWRFDLKSCCLQDITLLLDEINILTKTVVELEVIWPKIVKNRSTIEAAFVDEIFVIPLKLCKFRCFELEYPINSAEIFEKLYSLKLKNKLQFFSLNHIPQNMDPLLFAKFIKNNADFNAESVRLYLSWKNEDEE